MKCKIWVVLFGVAAAMLFYGCGGSGYVSELSEGLDDGVHQMIFSADAGSIDSQGTSKEYVRDGVEAEPIIRGESSDNSIYSTCTLSDAAISGITNMQVVDAEAACTDPNHCAIITFTSGSVCNIDADIRAYSSDVTPSALLMFDINLETTATTNMESDTGALLFTMEDDAGANYADLSTFSLTGCDAAPAAGEFQVDDTLDPWSSPNDDLRTDPDGIREFVGISEVNPSSGVASCTMAWKGSFEVDISALQTGDIDIGGGGEILLNFVSELCTERSETGCAASTLYGPFFP